MTAPEPFDPDQAYREMRRLAGELTDAAQAVLGDNWTATPIELLARSATRLVCQIMDLDRWLCAEGELPAPWYRLAPGLKGIEDALPVEKGNVLAGPIFDGARGVSDNPTLCENREEHPTHWWPPEVEPVAQRWCSGVWPAGFNEAMNDAIRKVSDELWMEADRRRWSRLVIVEAVPGTNKAIGKCRHCDDATEALPPREAESLAIKHLVDAHPEKVTKVVPR